MRRAESSPAVGEAADAVMLEAEESATSLRSVLLDDAGVGEEGEELAFSAAVGQVSTSKRKTRLRSCRDPSPDRVDAATSLRSVAAQEYLRRRRGRGWRVASVGSAASGGRRGCWQSISVSVSSVSVSSVSVSSSGSGRGSGTTRSRKEAAGAKTPW
jgi:hypothetical protein